MYDAIDDVRVVPLVETSWGQGEHQVQGAYNYYTPNLYVCGCVATAGAQIMRYWRFPIAAVAAGTFACAVDSVVRKFTMKGGTYDWANMPTNYVAGTTTDTEAEAIGKLVFDVGVAVSTGWKASGGGSLTANLPAAFTGTFGYASAAIAGHASGTGLSIDEMKRTILPSLDAGMPCVIGIGGANTAHSAVCDGYGYHKGELYLHVNMGQLVRGERTHPRCTSRRSTPAGALRQRARTACASRRPRLPHSAAPDDPGYVKASNGAPLHGVRLRCRTARWRFPHDQPITGRARSRAADRWVQIVQDGDAFRLELAPQGGLHLLIR